MKIRAYHGTPFNFDDFDSDYAGYATGGEGTSHGFFFAEDEAHAEYWCERNSLELQYQAETDPHILLCELDIEALFEADMTEYGYIDDIVAAAEAADCDGIKISNANDDESGEGRTMYLVFDCRKITIIERKPYQLYL